MILPKTEEELQALLEKSYLEGERAVLVSQLRKLNKDLGYENITIDDLISEREAAITALNELCRCHGDLDFDTNLHLADIINKHLAPYLD